MNHDYDPDQDDANLTRDCVVGCEPATAATGTALRTKIEAAGQEELGKLYEALVGYDPFENDVDVRDGRTEGVDFFQAALLGFCAKAGLL